MLTSHAFSNNFSTFVARYSSTTAKCIGVPASSTNWRKWRASHVIKTVNNSACTPQFFNACHGSPFPKIFGQDMSTWSVIHEGLVARVLENGGAGEPTVFGGVERHIWEFSKVKNQALSLVLNIVISEPKQHPKPVQEIHAAAPRHEWQFSKVFVSA